MLIEILQKWQWKIKYNTEFKLFWNSRKQDVSLKYFHSNPSSRAEAAQLKDACITSNSLKWQGSYDYFNEENTT